MARPSPAIESFRRAELETRIEELIALLDLLDGDADAEAEEDNEPSLGWPEDEAAKEYFASADDRELEDDDEDGGDTEPNGDELDLNGDETDYSGYSEEWPTYFSWSGDGTVEAVAMIESNPRALARALRHLGAPPSLVSGVM